MNTTDPNSVLELPHYERDPNQFETQEDILFLRHGVIREKCQYAPVPLLSSSPLDVNKIEEVNTLKAIRSFKNVENFRLYLNNFVNLNSMALKDQSKLNCYSEEAEKLDLNATLKPGASQRTLVGNIKNDEKEDKTGKPRWPHSLPIHLGLSKETTKVDESAPHRQSLVRRTFRRIFSIHDGDYQSTRRGPCAAEFTFYPKRGKIDIFDEFAIKLSEHAISELKHVNNYDSALEFTNTYGSDYLVCEFYRHRLEYRLCQIESYDPSLVEVESRETSRREELKVNDHLRGIATSMLRENSPSDSLYDYPAAKKINITRGNVDTILYEAIDGTQQWIPVWTLVKKFQEESRNSIPENAWFHLKDVWVFRAVMTDLKTSYFADFRRNRSYNPHLTNFDFDSYWNNSILREVEEIYKYAIAESQSHSDRNYNGLIDEVTNLVKTIYYQDANLIYRLYHENIYYFGREVNLTERLEEMEKTQHVLAFFYDRKSRVKQLTLFNRMMDNFVLFIRTWNMTSSTKSPTPRMKYVGVMIDVLNHPHLLEQTPGLKDNFLIDRGYLPICQHQNWQNVLDYSGLYLVSLSNVAISYDYTTLDLSSNMFCLMNPLMTSRFKSIETLDLSSNSIEFLEWSPFSELDLLETLNLRRNLIQHISNRDFKGLKKLKTLDLSSNRISKIDSDAFGELNELEILKLGSNALQTIDTKNYPFANKLIKFDLSHNQIRAFPTLEMPKLTELYINDNQLDKLNPKMFEYLVNVEILNLSHNYLTRLVEKTFSYLPNLEIIFVNSNRLVWIADSAFAFCNRLKFVSLADNRLVNLQPAVFIQHMLLNDYANRNPELYSYLVSTSGAPFPPSRLKCVLLYGNLLGKRPYVYYWKTSDTFERERFPKLKNLMLEYDHEKLFDVTDSKKFKKYKNVMRREVFRYGIENNLYE